MNVDSVAPGSAASTKQLTLMEQIQNSDWFFHLITLVDETLVGVNSLL